MMDFVSPIFSSIDSGFLIYVLLLALAFDILIGEPPAAVHPVVWIGKFIQVFRDHAPSSHRKSYGVLMGLATIAFASLIGLAVLLVATFEPIPEAVRLLFAAYFLKSTFAVQSLLSPAKEISYDLINDRLQQARDKLPIFVSRDPSSLSKEQASSAVIESVSENYVDGILTPLFYYMLLGPFGLIGAYAYKAVNTLDSMIGYRDETYLELGFFSAKLDDILNWIPARLSILFIAGASAVISVFSSGKADVASSLKLASTQAHNTPSPNSGYPMAATAGAIRVRLEKPNNYVLGDEYSVPQPDDIQRTSQIIFIASILSVAAIAAVINYLWT